MKVCKLVLRSLRIRSPVLFLLLKVVHSIVHGHAATLSYQPVGGRPNSGTPYRITLFRQWTCIACYKILQCKMLAKRTTPTLINTTDKRVENTQLLFYNNRSFEIQGVNIRQYGGCELVQDLRVKEGCSKYCRRSGVSDCIIAIKIITSIL